MFQRARISQALALMCLAGLHQLAAVASPSIYPTGVTRYDPAKAYNSYVLFTAQDKKTHLIDLNGNEVHRWDHEGFPPVLLDPALTGGQRGRVLLQLSNLQGPQAGGNGLRNQSIGELDWSSRVVWEWKGVQAQQAYGGVDTNTEAKSGGGAKQHHDWRRLPNGNTLVLVNVVHPIKGFKADNVLDDAIYEVSPAGTIVWQWTAADHLNEFGFSEASLQLIRDTITRNDKTIPFDYLHFNNMSVVGPNKWFDAGDVRFHPDNIVVDARNANFIAIIEKMSGKVVWRLGPDYAPTQASGKVPRPVDQIIGQHDAHIIGPGLPGAGNLLVFDNQGAAGYPVVSPGTQPRSRVLEIDPVKKEIVWQYTGTDSGGPAWSFYSSFISSARRLPNGNTLIDEGMNGRVFQITPVGEIVWEYVSPYFGESRTGGDGKAYLSNTLYRAQPVPYDWVPAGTPRSEKAVTPPDIRSFRVPSAP